MCCPHSSSQKIQLPSVCCAWHTLCHVVHASVWMCHAAACIPSHEQATVLKPNQFLVLLCGIGAPPHVCTARRSTDRAHTFVFAERNFWIAFLSFLLWCFLYRFYALVLEHLVCRIISRPAYKVVCDDAACQLHMMQLTGLPHLPYASMQWSHGCMPHGTTACRQHFASPPSALCFPSSPCRIPYS